MLRHPAGNDRTSLPVELRFRRAGDLSFARVNAKRRPSAGFLATLAAVGLIAAGLFWWLGRTTTEPSDGAYIPRETPVTPEVALLQRYVRVDTTNPPGNETAGARLLQQELADRGVEPELIESAPGRGNLYARVEGSTDEPGLLLLHHIDVAPTDPRAWSEPPFSGNIRANQIWGRGTLDMKGIGIAHLEAFVEIAKGPKPRRDVVFLATADEEVSRGFGVEWLLARRPEIFDNIGYVLTEGGVTEVIAEKLIYFGVETGSKQIVRVDLTGSRESLTAARLALEPHFDPKVGLRLLPEVEHYFRSIAPHREQFGPLLANIGQALATGAEWRLSNSYLDLMRNNIFAREIRPSGSSYRMEVVLLNLPDVEPESSVDRLRNLVRGLDVEVVVTQSMGPSTISSVDTPMFALLKAEIRKHFGEVSVGPHILSNVVTDARFLRARGMQCYGFWPYRVDFYQSRGIHGNDERLRVDWFVEGVDLMKRIVVAYARSDNF